MSTERSGDPAPDTAESARLRDAATRLFAVLGYDGTATEMIADAAGVPREQVVAAGGRSGLYRQALEEHCREQCLMLEEIGQGFRPGDDRMAIVLEHLMDFYLARQDLVAMWRQRRMMDAADMTDLEERYQYPIHQKVLAILGPDVVESPEYELIGVVFAWCLLGFTAGGAPRPDGSLLDPDDPRDRALFRSHMIELMEKLRSA
ncbi:TetR/AcrR family transcriptional regulator [Actinomadura rugatobispora]|uniref:TetR/AcrR family transcriptional regulator n=1 Tax=Actinomadura rugatobispora TaxID=1994 RepID=A0ABW0ZYV7_9ACTN